MSVIKKKVETKRCTKCNEVKEMGEFPFKNKAKGILDSKCRICKAKQSKLIRDRKRKSKEVIKRGENNSIEENTVEAS